MATAVSTLILAIQGRNDTKKTWDEIRAQTNEQVAAAREAGQKQLADVKAAAADQVRAVKEGLAQQQLALRQAMDNDLLAVRSSADQQATTLKNAARNASAQQKIIADQLVTQIKADADRQALDVRHAYESMVQAARQAADQQVLALRGAMDKEVIAVKAAVDKQVLAVREGAEKERLALAGEGGGRAGARGGEGSQEREMPGAGLLERGKDILGFTAGLAAVSALAEGIHELPASFLEATNAGQQFTTQMRQFYGSQEAANRVLEYGNQFAITYGLSIDQTREAIAKAASSGQDVGKLLPAGANIAAAFHTSLPDFMDMFNRAFATGSARGLESFLHMSKTQLAAIGVEFDKHGKIIASSLAPALERLAQSRYGDAAAAQAHTMGGALQSVRGVWEVFKETAGNALVKGLQGPLNQAVGWLKTHQALLQHFATIVGGAMGKAAQAVVHFALGAWPVVVKAFHTVQAAWPALHTVWTAMTQAIGGAIRTIGELAGGISTLIPHFGQAHVSAQSLAGVLKTVGTALGFITVAVGTYMAVTKAIKIATEAWTAVQWLLNAAMTANPIGLVVVALAALVLAVVYAWNHVKWFHDLVVTVWRFLQGSLGPILGTIGNTLRGAFAAAWEAAKKAANDVWNAVKVVWQLFKDNVLPILGQVGDTLKGAFSAAWKTAQQAAQDVWDMLQKFWDWLNNTLHLDKIGQGIKDALGGAFDFVKKKIDDFIGGFEKLLSGLEKLPGMGWIKATLEALGKAQKEVKQHDDAARRHQTVRHGVQQHQHTHQHVHQHLHQHTHQHAHQHKHVHTTAHTGTGGTGGEGVPPLLHPAATGPGAAQTVTSAADTAKAAAKDFSTAMTYFKAQKGLDPADVKRMQADIAAIAKSDPQQAAHLQALLTVAQQQRDNAIRHQGAVAAHHAQVQAHHNQVTAQRAAHHAQTVAHQTALRNANADVSTLLKTIQNEIREHRLAQAAAHIGQYRVLVQQDDKLKGLDPVRAKADADARAKTLLDALAAAQARTVAAALRTPIAPVPRYGALAGETGYGGVTVSFGGAQVNPTQQIVAALREQLAESRAQTAMERARAERDERIIALLETGNVTEAQQLAALRGIDHNIGHPPPARSAHSVLRAAGSYAPVTR